MINYKARSLYLLRKRHRYSFVRMLGGSHSEMDRGENKIFRLNRELKACFPVIQFTALSLYRLRYSAHDYRI
jgi:hypothetical protein